MFCPKSNTRSLCSVSSLPLSKLTERRRMFCLFCSLKCLEYQRMFGISAFSTSILDTWVFCLFCSFKRPLDSCMFWLVFCSKASRMLKCSVSSSVQKETRVTIYSASPPLPTSISGLSILYHFYNPISQKQGFKWSGSSFIQNQRIKASIFWPACCLEVWSVFHVFVFAFPVQKWQSWAWCLASSL